MKRLKLILILFLLLITLVTKAQQGYYNYQAIVSFADTAYFPIGISPDSFVITNNPVIDSIFKYFKVTKVEKTVCLTSNSVSV